MYIQHLILSNFRGFTRYKVDFTRQTTVLIGRNGASKSSLISALYKALSFVFSNDKSLGEEFLSAGNPSLKVNSYETDDFHKDAATRTVAPDANIHAEASYNDAPLVWDMYKRSTANASLYPSKYKEAFQVFMHEWKDNRADLPLLAFYSDSYPHVNVKESEFALGQIRQDMISRNFGYYQWDAEAACTSIWETRLCNQMAKRNPLYTPAQRVASRMIELEETLSVEQLVQNAEYKSLKAEEQRLLLQMDKLSAEINFVENRLNIFVEKLPMVVTEGYQIDYLSALQTVDGYRLNITFKNGRDCLLQALPAGYKRIYSIVFDMAYRAYILNGDKEPSGIVMIDEVDLHLHPSLEQEIVRCLQETFPKIQFIITTHSAAVISNINTSLNDPQGNPLNSILFMQEGQEQADVLPNIYGLDYNAALRDFMDTPSRNQDVKRMMDEYLVFYGHQLIQEADTLYAKLLDLLGTEEHPLMEELRERRKVYEVH